MRTRSVFFATAFCIFCVNILNSYSQNFTNVWYFGLGAGLDFNYSPPQPITGPIFTNEGVATICNASGQLLFATDGMQVFNRTLVVMPNGSGLLGDPSSTQSGVIVPDPADDSSYYIFAAAAQGRSAGITYSLVDMRLDNGLGDVVTTTKNVQLVTPATEKITAISHANGIDYWILCHKYGSNEFYAYLLTKQGVSSPVISATGVICDVTAWGNNTIGYMKSSPDGKKIACAHAYPGDILDNTFIELFDFDACSGVVSLATTIDAMGNAYGVSFSPDGKMLYASFDCSTTDSCLIQYQFSGNTVIHRERLINYSQILNFNSSGFAGALQVGPDQKMYVAAPSSYVLHCVNQPNVPGTGCNVVVGQVNLGNNMVVFGFPNSIEKRKSSLLDMVDQVVCPGDTVHFEINTACWSQVLWSDGGTDNHLDATTTGTYWVRVSNTDTTITDSVYLDFSGPKIIGSYNIKNIFCSGILGSTAQLSVPTGRTSYQWTDGGNVSSRIVSSTGQYICISELGCAIFKDTFIVNSNTSNNVKIKDIDTCTFPVTLTADARYQNPVWSPGTATRTFAVPGPGTYILTGQDTCDVAFTLRDTVVVTQPAPPPPLNLGADTAICDFPFQLGPFTGYSSLAWGHGGNAPTTTISSPGKYTLVAIGDCPQYILSDMIDIQLVKRILLPAFPDSGIICHGVGVDIPIPSGYQTMAWSDGHAGGTRTIQSVGEYSFTAFDGCETYQDSIFIRDAYQPQLAAPSLWCEDSSLTINVLSDSIPAGTVLYWDLPNAKILNSNDSSIMINYKNYGYYIAKVTAWDHGCLSSGSVPLAISERPSAIWLDSAACSGDTLAVAIIPAQNGGNYTYTYSAGSANSLIQSGKPEPDALFLSAQAGTAGKTTAQITVQTPACPLLTTQREIRFVQRPVAALTPIFTQCWKGQFIQLLNLSQFSQKANWLAWDVDADRELSFISQNYTNAVFQPFHAGEFLIKLEVISDTANCRDTVFATILAENPGILFPTAFSPNGDGTNPVFSLVYQGVESLQLQIFDRWGHLMFETSDRNFAWDGTFRGQAVPEGSYRWVAEGAFENGQPFQTNGVVTIVR